MDNEGFPAGPEARLQLQMSLAEVERLSGDISGLLKWILASLLTLNAGGLVAVLNSGAHDIRSAIPVSSFLIGITLGIACAHRVISRIEKIVPAIINLAQLSAKAAESGYWHTKAVVEASTKIQKSANRTWLTYIISWASFLCFVIGVSALFVSTIDTKERLASAHSTSQQAYDQITPSSPADRQRKDSDAALGQP